MFIRIIKYLKWDFSFYNSTDCQVINHNPICSCKPNLIGDPFVRCVERQHDELVPERINPCSPSPCGNFAECRPVGDSPSCSCLPNYFGKPPNCRPECVVNSDCPSDKSCIAERCRNPCEGSCGFNSGRVFQDQIKSIYVQRFQKLANFSNRDKRALMLCSSTIYSNFFPPFFLSTECRIQNHIPICTCRPHYTGDPFTQCFEIIEKPEPKPSYSPCDPNPCGSNAVCDNAICTCIRDYFGDPYGSGCRPECTMNTECSPSKACINNKCVDPCPGTCGTQAVCDVSNHIPSCSCPQGYSGDPFVACRHIEYDIPKDLCNPSPCKCFFLIP